MELDRTCKLCPESANCYCRMCAAHYCPDHYCHHLQVAHEDNSYTKRLQVDINEEGKFYVSERLQSPIQPVQYESNLFKKSQIRIDANNPQSYSQAELQEAYDFHRNQSRRIRAELERRALFASGVVATDWTSECFLSKKQRKNKNLQSKPSNKQSRAIQFLCDRLRSNHISLGQIKAQITAYQAKK
jgi:hypothetical protein